METPVLGLDLRCPQFFSTSSRCSSSLLPPVVSVNCTSRRILATASPAAAAVTASPVVELPSTVAEASRSRPHSQSYTTRKSAISEVERSSDFLSSLQRLERVLKVQDLNAILRNFGLSGRLQDLIQLFDWMQQHGKISGSTYGSYIKFVGAKSVLKALEIYEGIPDESIKINVYVCNSILSCLVKNGKLDSCIKLFDQMKRDGLKPDVVTYNTLLAGCIKTKNRYLKAMELVGELPQHGIQMDSVMYGTLLAICASNGRCEEAQSFIQQMKVEGHSPNIYHYSSLLNSYAWNGDYKKSDELMNEMTSVGLVPNKVMKTTLLKVYIKGGLFERSREYLAELESEGYAENEMPYCMLMDGLSKAGKLEEAMSVFDDMKRKGAKSDGYANSIMISSLCRSGRFANFWCTTSILIKWKRLFTTQSLKSISLAATVLAALPSMVQQILSPSNEGFLYGLLNSSMAFYMFSFQVHEKSFLMPFLSATLLALKLSDQFSHLTYYALFSMFPLLCRDKLLLPYVTLSLLFTLIFHSPGRHPLIHRTKAPLLSFSGYVILLRTHFFISLVLHVLYLTVQPPQKYPFLFEALIMLLCFTYFVMFALHTNYIQWTLSRHIRHSDKEKKQI